MKKYISLAVITALLLTTALALGDPPKFSGGSQPTPKPSFSGGSQPTPKPSFTGGGTKPAQSQPSFSGNKTTPNTGSKPSFTGGSQPTAQGQKPTGPTIDSAAGAAQKKAESKAAMQRAETPAPKYVDPKGKEHDIDPKDVHIQQLRNQLDHEKWVNRENRERDFYRNYYSRPVVVYHDPYSSYFWWWLLDQPIEYRAMWAYNHRASMDAARYQELCNRDAMLAARIAQLERDKVRLDPTYTPPGLDADLQYSDDYVNAAINPHSSGSVGAAFGYLLIGMITVGGIVFLVWLILIKEWK